MISVVIPTCCRPHTLARCLDHLRPGAQSLSALLYEVIVTDDGETTVEQLLAEEYPWARWSRGPRRGPAANRNAGASRARGEWLAFTDDDCVPAQDWLAGFVNACSMGYQVYEGKTTCVSGIQSPLQHAPVNLTGGWLWSCNIFMRKKVFEEIGGFDEAFVYPHMEDVDLRERLVEAGYPFEFVPGAVVDHPPRRRPSGRQNARYQESWVYFWYKRRHRRFASPRLLAMVARFHLHAIARQPKSADSVWALASLVNELLGIIVRLPLWEWKYRWRLRSASPR